MNEISKILFYICLAGSVWPLFRGVWPGALNFLNFLLLTAAVFTVPPMVVIWLVVFVISLSRLWKENKTKAVSSIKYLISALGLTGIVILLLVFNIPIRSAFFVTKWSFENVVNAEDFSLEASGNQRIGIWYVDQCKADNKGGVYFRIGKKLDGFSPDTMSFGFAFQPDQKTSPFGGARYKLSRITGKWYYFSVSNDYY